MTAHCYAGFMTNVTCRLSAQLTGDQYLIRHVPRLWVEVRLVLLYESMAYLLPSGVFSVNDWGVLGGLVRKCRPPPPLLQ